MEAVSGTKSTIFYNDSYIRIFLALIGSHIIVAFGEDYSIYELLLDPDYYRALVSSFLMAFLVITLVYRVTLYLDKKLDWLEQALARALSQLTFGLVFPALVAFLLAAIYFYLFDLHILDTVYLKYDFPVIVLMLILVNGYYTGFYFYKRTVQPAEDIGGVMIVHRSEKRIPLKVEDIAYCYHQDGNNFIRTNDGEEFLSPVSLDKLSDQLPDTSFFKVNRKMIINRDACEHFVAIDQSRLELFVRPEFQDNIIIGQKKVKVFKDWIIISKT